MRNRLIILILCLFILTGCYKASYSKPYAKEEVERLVLQANKAYERRDLNLAQKLYVEALKKAHIIQDDNATVIILISLSRLCTSMNQPEKAKEFIELADKFSEISTYTASELSFEKARLNFLTNDLDKAEELLKNTEFESLLKIKSLNLLARIKIKRESFDEAEEFLKEAINLNQGISKIELANSYRLLGDIYSNRDKKAENYYLKALEIDKELALPEKIALDLESLGRFYEKWGDKERAKQYLLRAAEIRKALELLNFI